MWPVLVLYEVAMQQPVGRDGSKYPHFAGLGDFLAKKNHAEFHDYPTT